MKKIILFSLFTVFLITISSCTKNIPTCQSCDFNCIEEIDDSVITSNNCLEDHTCEFEIFPDSKVNHFENNGIKNSNNSFVIRFSTSTEGSPNIADDEYYTSYLLEIPNANDSFSVSGEEVKDLNASMRRSCFCTFTDWKYFDNGCIQGEKIDGTWYVQGNVTSDYYTNGDPLVVKFDFSVK